MQAHIVECAHCRAPLRIMNNINRMIECRYCHEHNRLTINDELVRVDKWTLVQDNELFIEIPKKKEQKFPCIYCKRQIIESHISKYEGYYICDHCCKRLEENLKTKPDNSDSIGCGMTIVIFIIVFLVIGSIVHSCVSKSMPKRVTVPAVIIPNVIETPKSITKEEQEKINRDYLEKYALYTNLYISCTKKMECSPEIDKENFRKHRAKYPKGGVTSCYDVNRARDSAHHSNMCYRESKLCIRTYGSLTGCNTYWFTDSNFNYLYHN